MAKRVIRLSRGGAAVSQPPAQEISLKGPRAPVKLGQVGQTSAAADMSRTQPMKRFVVASKGHKKRTPSVSTGTRTPTGQQPEQKRKPVKSSGPPLWLIPVGIIGVVILIVIIVSASSGSKRDPYFNGGPVVQQQAPEPRMRRDGPRPMKEWMEQHGETEMAKARRERRTGR